MNVLQVNEKFSIDLVAEEAVEVVKDRHVYCNGGKLHFFNLC